MGALEEGDEEASKSSPPSSSSSSSSSYQDTSSASFLFRKDFFAGKSSKNGAYVKNLALLIVLGLCGISMCLINMDQAKMLRTSSNYVIHSQKNASNFFLCQRSADTVGSSFMHYPEPKTYDRRECSCTPVRNFVILSMQRSGSGWFETLLNNHPNISSHGEIFSVKSRRENFSMISNTLDDIYNLDWISSASKNECTAAVGLKWMLNQGVMEYSKEISKYFQQREVSVIFLLRKNILRRLISVLANAYDREAKLLNGTHKSHVHSREEADNLAAYKPTINVTQLPNNLQRVQDITKDALNFFSNNQHMVLYYEDIVRDSKKIEEVEEFLGVPLQELESRQVKIHTRPLREQVHNWPHVYASLKGTQFQSFLEPNDYK